MPKSKRLGGESLLRATQNSVLICGFLVQERPGRLLNLFDLHVKKGEKWLRVRRLFGIIMPPERVINKHGWIENRHKAPTSTERSNRPLPSCLLSCGSSVHLSCRQCQHGSQRHYGDAHCINRVAVNLTHRLEGSWLFDTVGTRHKT